MLQVVLALTVTFWAVTSWTGPSAAKPVREATPLGARSSEVEILVLGIDLGRFRTPDLRRIEPELARLLAKELRQAGYGVRDASEVVSTEDKDAEPAHALAGEVAAFDCVQAVGKACGIVIEWALIDFDSGAVTYRVRTSHEETELAAVGKSEAARAVVRGAIRSLLGRAKFETAVFEPRDVYRTRLPQKSIRACGDEKLSMPKDAERVLGATVVVRTPDGVGSAVSVSPDGYLLTAAHVVSGYEKKGVMVIPRDGRQVRATVVRYDEGSDVALLKIDAGPTAANCLALSQTAAKAGEDVYVVGAPAGEELSFSMSRGILSGRRHLYGNDYLQTDASINPGNSGGPLLNESAGVLGIVSWKMSGQALEGLGFAVEIASALDALSLSTAPATSVDLAAERGRTNVLAKPLVDAADPTWQVVGQAKDSHGPAARHAGGRSELVGILRGAGLLALVLGGTTVVISAAANSGNTTDPGAYYTARTFNDIGWIVTGVGAAAIATSFVIPLFGKSDRSQARGLGVRAGLDGLGVRIGLEVAP